MSEVPAGLGALVVPLTLADVETTVAVSGDPASEVGVVPATGAAAADPTVADLAALTAGGDTYL